MHKLNPQQHVAPAGRVVGAHARNTTLPIAVLHLPIGFRVVTEVKVREVPMNLQKADQNFALQ